MQYILSLAFRYFKQRDSYSASPTAANGEIIAALYAEVLGVLAQACFLSVKKRFVAEFKEYQNNPSVFVNIIYGMKYLRIKVCTLFFIILIQINFEHTMVVVVQKAATFISHNMEGKCF